MYIDAELLKVMFAKRLNEHFGIMLKIDDVAVDLGLTIADMPTTDVVEVVRCKDCKYSEVADNGRFHNKIYCLQPAPIKQIVETEENRFCSYGDRRTGSFKE